MSKRTPVLLFPLALVFMFFCFFGGTPRPDWDSLKKDLNFGAWLTYWDFSKGLQAISDGNNDYRDVFLFIVHLDSEGVPRFSKTGIDYAAVVAGLKEKGKRVWLTVVNDIKTRNGNFLLKDPKATHKILADEKLRARHLQRVVGMAVLFGFDGVDIDYENLFPEDREAFSRFVRELADELQRNGLKLSVTVQPKVREMKSLGSGANDWTEICAHADRLQIMLYNLHSQKTGPGPMATPGWISKVLRFAKQECAVERVVPILKISGMVWMPGKVHTIPYERAVSLMETHHALLERESFSQVPFFSYTVNEQAHTAYFEDEPSILEKLSRIRSMGFKDVVFWSLGQHDPRLINRSDSTENRNPNAAVPASAQTANP